MIRARALLSIAALVAIGAAACGPKPAVAFDASSVPQGSGWSCFPVIDPGGPQRGACFRTEAECFTEREKSGPRTDRCTPSPAAHCLHIADDRRLHCYTNEAGCDEFRRNYEAAYSISECRRVP